MKSVVHPNSRHPSQESRQRWRCSRLVFIPRPSRPPISLSTRISAAVLLPDASWGLIAAVTTLAASAQSLQRIPRVASVASPPVLAMVLAWFAAAFGIIPTSCALYDWIWERCIPLATALILLETNLFATGTRHSSSWAKALVSFLLASFCSCLGIYVAWTVMSGASLFGPEGWKVASALCASLVGGSLNMAAIVQATRLVDRSLITTMAAADNFAMMLFLLILFRIPVGKEEEEEEEPGTSGIKGQEESRASGESALRSLAAASICTALGHWVASSVLQAPSWSLALVALLAAGLGSLAHDSSSFSSNPSSSLFAGANALGTVCMMLFFITIGASAGNIESLTTWGTTALHCLLLMALTLTLHLGCLLLIGRRFLHLPMRLLLLASNAAVGGPATAAAMAVGRGWHRLVPISLLLGSIGYSIGTAIGLFMSSILR